MEKVTLYKSDSSGRTRVWECWAGTNESGEHGMFTTDGLLGGNMKEAGFKKSEEKNIGKSNFLDCESQAREMVANAKDKKLKNNYFSSLDSIESKLFKPMLAEKYEKRVSKLKYPLYTQPKLDGSRCNIYWCEIENRVLARSRTTKEIVSVPHIVESLKEFLSINKNIILDGELYNHDFSENFEDLMSITRQMKPTKEDLDKSEKYLEYHVYDLYVKDSPDLSFTNRLDLLESFFNHGQLPNYIVFVETNLVNNVEELDEFNADYLDNNYEGQMVRVPSSEYKVDGRSAELLKRKEFTDEEFEIVGLEEGTGPWAGAAKKVIIKLPDGRTQGTGIDGSYEVNAERLRNVESIKGKMATVRYFRFTSDGKLYIPVTKDIDRHD